jgi:hypothetical protein
MHRGAICSLQPASKRRQQHQLPTKTEDEQSRHLGSKNLTRAGNTAAETKRERGGPTRAGRLDQAPWARYT